jgi:hypothetical protein
VHPAARAQRDGYVDPHRGVLDRFATATQQRAQAAGRGRQEDVVDRRPVAVRDLLDRLEGGSDQGEVAAGTDHPVEAGRGRGLLREELAGRRPRRPQPPHGGPGPGKHPECGGEPLAAAREVVGEELACRRGPRGRPRACWWSGRVWRGVEERADRGHRRHAVRDGVVQLHEQGDLALRQPGQQPHLPQGP